MFENGIREAISQLQELASETLRGRGVCEDSIERFLPPDELAATVVAVLLETEHEVKYLVAEPATVLAAVESAIGCLCETLVTVPALAADFELLVSRDNGRFESRARAEMEAGDNRRARVFALAHLALGWLAWDADDPDTWFQRDRIDLFWEASAWVVRDRYQLAA